MGLIRQALHFPANPKPAPWSANEVFLVKNVA
jgi:hypothetical protein